MLKLFKEIVNNQRGWGLPETVITTIMVSALAVAGITVLRAPVMDTVTTIGTKLKNAAEASAGTSTGGPTWDN